MNANKNDPKQSAFQDSIDGGFLQSQEWKFFQKEIGRKTYGIQENSFNAFCIVQSLPIVGDYFFIPRGPIIECRMSNVECRSESGTANLELKESISKLVRMAKREGAGWIRIEPQSKNDLSAIKKALSDDHKIVKSKKDHEPAQTLMIDLGKSEEDILKEMKSKTRYNVRLAQRKGVTVERAHDERSIDEFCRLTKITAQRDGITPHPEKYYRKMFATIPEKSLSLYLAHYQEKIIATIVVSFFGSVATYLHGASANEHRNVMAPFALQWQAIRDAKKLGYKHYDFGGTKINKDGSYEKNWAGISRFKQGFCPKCRPVEFPGCWDIILNEKKYKLYQVLQFAKDLAKRLKSRR